jgi:hypothetical protein
MEKEEEDRVTNKRPERHADMSAVRAVNEKLLA